MNAEDQMSSGLEIGGSVLAGGGSARFGRDKALVEFGGKSMLAHMIQLLQSVPMEVRVISARGKYSEFGTEVIEDQWPGEGPLGGIITALEDAAKSATPPEWNLIVSCDMPFLTREWLTYLIGRALTSEAQVVLPHSASGPEPLCACWRTDAAETLRAAFERGVRKVTDGIALLRSEVLDESAWKRFDNAGRLFWNMNTAADFEQVRRVWETGRA
jgi:molybdopterin-guanine dinucleotide biosynthesis protein A